MVAYRPPFFLFPQKTRDGYVFSNYINLRNYHSEAVQRKRKMQEISWLLEMACVCWN